MTTKMTGVVKSFDMAKGYGYIEAGNGQTVFVYYQSIIDGGLRNLAVGERVEFLVKNKPSGPVALDVSRI